MKTRRVAVAGLMLGSLLIGGVVTSGGLATARQPLVQSWAPLVRPQLQEEGTPTSTPTEEQLPTPTEVVPTATPSPGEVSGVVASFGYDPSDGHVEFCTGVQDPSWDATIYAESVQDQEGQSLWSTAQAGFAPDGWTLRQIDGGWQVVTVTDPLRYPQYFCWGLIVPPGTVLPDTILVYLFDQSGHLIGWVTGVYQPPPATATGTVTATVKPTATVRPTATKKPTATAPAIEPPTSTPAPMTATPGETPTRTPSTPGDVEYGHHVYTPGHYCPVVVVPGFLGTKLRNSAGQVVWPPITVSHGIGLKGFLNVVADSHITSGWIPDAVRLGSPEGEFPTAYTPLLQEFEKIGYVFPDNLWFYGYNWTLSNEVSGKGLVAFVKTFLADFNARHHTDVKRACAVVHSMGGLVTRSAILQGAKISYVSSIDSPQRGGFKAYYALAPHTRVTTLFLRDALDGWVAGHIVDHVLSGAGLPNHEEIDTILKRAVRSWQSVYELLPDHYYFKHIGHGLGPVVCIDHLHLAGSNEHHCPRTLTGTYVDARDDGVFALKPVSHVEDAMAFKQGLGPRIRDAQERAACKPAAGDLCLYPYEIIGAGGEHTDNRMDCEWGRVVGKSCGLPYQEGLGGDETVEAGSQRGADEWADLGNVSHSDAPNDSDAFTLIVQCILRHRCNNP